MANHAVLLKHVATMAPCRAANVTTSCSKQQLPSLPVRGGASAKRLVARSNVYPTGFLTPEAVVPNCDIWSIRESSGVEVLWTLTWQT